MGDLRIEKHIFNKGNGISEYVNGDSSLHYYDVCGYDYSQDQRDSIFRFVKFENKRSQHVGDNYYMFMAVCNRAAPDRKPPMGINEAEEMMSRIGIAEASMSNDTVIWCLYYKNGLVIDHCNTVKNSDH